jgi:hypothetical protein
VTWPVLGLVKASVQSPRCCAIARAAPGRAFVFGAQRVAPFSDLARQDRERRRRESWWSLPFGERLAGAAVRVGSVLRLLAVATEGSALPRWSGMALIRPDGYIAASLPIHSGHVNDADLRDALAVQELRA